MNYAHSHLPDKKFFVKVVSMKSWLGLLIIS